MTKSTQRIIAFIMALVAGSVMAGAIHTWSTGEKLTSADLNANFQHIHNLMVGGHGARLVDADVSGSAAISTSKLAGKANIPKAWGRVDSTCSSSPCTIVASQGISTITKTSTGNYTVNLSYTASDVNYAVLVSQVFNGTQLFCRPFSYATGSFTINCVTTADFITATNAGFEFLVIDDN